MKRIGHLGIGFSDSLGISSKNQRRISRITTKTSKEIGNLLFVDHESPATREAVSRWRLAPVKIFVALCCVVMLSRLFQMQIVNGDTMRSRSDANRLLVKTIHAPRGIIFDRHGKPLVQNTPAFVRVSTDSAELVSYDDALAIEATRTASSLEVQAVRNYPLGSVLSHVLGYTSEISKDELGSSSLAKVYRNGDRIGRAGIEQIYEPYLRGQDGATYFEVDALHNTTRQVGQDEPIQGKDVMLAIDADLDQTSYNELKAALDKLHLTAGVVVVSKPKTGEILALVSLPSYDNNMFSKHLDNNQYNALLQDQSRPFFDRAISGVYPPGSLFKIVTSTAGLLSGKVTADTKIQDTGVIKIDQYSFTNWLYTASGRTEGIIDIIKAIATSNDIFFYQVGSMVGPDYLSQVAQTLGFGKRTGIDLPAEATGLIPTIAWKKAATGQIWYPGDTYHMAIGQGDNLVTPLQLNLMTNFIANNGIAYKPELATVIRDISGKETRLLSDKPIVSNVHPANNIALIREGMHQVCEPGGTAYPLFNFSISHFEELPNATQAAEVKQPVDLGCKTGTAEYGTEGKTHAWFTVFAPYQNPEVSVTVLIEGGGEGSDVAAPVAKNILSFYFTHNN